MKSSYGHCVGIFALTFCSVCFGGTYSGGSGTTADPFRIGTLADWVELTGASGDWDKQFILMRDLDISGVAMTAVGSPAVPFTGSLDGRGYRISNLYMYFSYLPDREYLGLFGDVGPGGQIRNLGLEKVDIRGTQYVGGIAGFNQGFITACYVTGMVNVLGVSNLGIGGMVGTNSGTVMNCYAKVTTTGCGLVGDNAKGTIANCYSASLTPYAEDNLAPSSGPYKGTITASFWEDLGKERMNPGVWPTDRTTAEMRRKVTYSVAGWDFVGETANGTADVWRMCEEGVDTPRLAWEFSGTGDFACPNGTEMADLLELASRWMKARPEEAGAADGTGDGIVNFDDFALLGEHWLFRQTGQLVGHWPLDGDYLSSVGGYVGTPVGDPEFVPEAEARMGSGALVLDNDDSVVVEGYKGITGSRARTCMAWIKTDRNINSLFWWGNPDKSGGLWQVGINHGGLQLNIRNGFLWTNTLVNTGQWVHVAVVLPDRTNRMEDVRLYVNGIQERNPASYSQGTMPVINTDGLRDFQIGVLPNFMGLIGLIDEIRVYDWAMSREEILLAGGVGGVDAGPDQTVELEAAYRRLTLDGYGYNINDDYLSVHWEKISGPDDAAILDPEEFSTRVDIFGEGDYVFRLTASDETRSFSDDVRVMVIKGQIGRWRFDGNLSDDFGHHGNARWSSYPASSPLLVSDPEARIGNGAVEMRGDGYVIV
ncbi:MAG: hypothetical protein GX455_12085, partial [Phycisphaerae bacterium]|nr:hypothetical protein [Phycisphaerae bacterium]